MPINYVLLCTISGIIGVVLTGFTAWHFSLAWKGQTTIECLEKTRYLSPMRKAVKRQRLGRGRADGQSYGQQLAEIHANTLPGITRDEEGEEIVRDGDLEESLTAHGFLQRDYNELERSRERERYEDYLDEQDSEKLPNAFDHGWRRNLRHLFGDKTLFWFLPICNTSGDGWKWEPSKVWLDAREEVRRKRENQWREQKSLDVGQRTNETFEDQRLGEWPLRADSERHYLTTSNGVAIVPGSGSRSPGKADKLLGRSPTEYFDDDSPSSRMSMRTLRRRGSFDGSTADEDSYDASSDEESTLAPTKAASSASKSSVNKHDETPDNEWREWE